LRNLLQKDNVEDLSCVGLADEENSNSSRYKDREKLIVKAGFV